MSRAEKPSYGRFYPFTILQILEDERAGKTLAKRYRIVALWSAICGHSSRSKNRQHLKATWVGLRTLAKETGLSLWQAWNGVHCLIDMGLLKQGVVDVPGKTPQAAWILLDEEGLYEKVFR